MTSRAEASFVCKSFSSNGLPHEWGAPAIRMVLKKKSGDATLALEVTEDTLRDPQTMKGLLLSAEKPLGCEHRHGMAGRAGLELWRAGVRRARAGAGRWHACSPVPAPDPAAAAASLHARTPRLHIAQQA